MAKNDSKKNEIVLPQRVDTFNQVEVLNSIRKLADKASAEVILNLSENRFVSIPFIKGLAALAEEVRGNGKALVLLNATEKIKKQIGIFSDLEIFTLRRTFLKPEWPLLGANADF